MSRIAQYAGVAPIQWIGCIVDLHGNLHLIRTASGWRGRITGPSGTSVRSDGPGQFFLNRQGQRRCSTADAGRRRWTRLSTNQFAPAVDMSLHDFHLHKSRWETNLIFGLVSSSEQVFPAVFWVFAASISTRSRLHPRDSWFGSATSIPILNLVKPAKFEWATRVTANLGLTLFFIVL
jgi:hypothetical protein